MAIFKMNEIWYSNRYAINGMDAQKVLLMFFLKNVQTVCRLSF